MHLPLLQPLSELDEGPRKFAWFTAWNTLSWQSLVGPAMVLFARHIEMPPAWVGVLIAALPFAQLLVLITAPLVARFGPKRVMFVAWAVRNVLVCSVFAMPLALAYGGNRLGWFLLLGATVAFCAVRAIGAGAWLPWLHEILPGRQRPKYFSVETGITHVMTILVILLQAWLLRGEPGIAGYLSVYAFGVFAGLTSLYAMTRIPGGASTDKTMALRASLRMQRIAVRDRQFAAFVFVAMLGYCGLTWLSASYIMFLRDGLGYTSPVIMLLTGLGSVAVLLTVRYWGRYATIHGSPAAMVRCLIGHAAVAAAFALLPSLGSWTPYLLVPVLLAAFAFASGYGVAAHGAMLDRVQDHARVGYTNLWVVGIALALGLTPVMAGAVIERLPAVGFQACFVAAAACGLLAALLGRAWFVASATPMTDPVPEDA